MNEDNLEGLRESRGLLLEDFRKEGVHMIFVVKTIQQLEKAFNSNA